MCHYVGKRRVRIGMVVGSFPSISLHRPAVGFFPGKQTSNWRDIAPGGRWCVNVLGRGQVDICRRFAAKAADEFAIRLRAIATLRAAVNVGAVT